MSAKAVEWSAGRDWKAGNATVREALQRSPHLDAFLAAVEAFTARASRHERVYLCWWDAPLAYIQVIDDRNHYPCNLRALVSFDVDSGRFADPRSRLHGAFARNGWYAPVFAITHRKARRMLTCAQPAREHGCRPSPAGERDGLDEHATEASTAGQTVTGVARGQHTAQLAETARQHAAADEPAGLIPQQFLARMPGVDRFNDSPLWPVRIAFDPRSWSQAPVEEVRIDSLHRTQRRVCKKYLGGRGNDRAGVGKDRPWVVRVNGQNWIADGHHRIVDDAMGGKLTITAYVRVQPETPLPATPGGTR